MTSIQNYQNYFPPTPPHNYPFPPQVLRNPPPPPPPRAKPPTHSTGPPPSPNVKPPPPHPHFPPPPPHVIPKPPPSPIVTPPPHPNFQPPPPHVVPTPPPPPPGHHSTVIAVVFVPLGGLLFLAMLSIALCFFIKKRKKRTIQETDIIKIDEHVKIQEAIIPGPHGPQVVVLNVEKDEHIEEEIRKNEISVSNGLHLKSSEHHPDKALEMGTTASSSMQHHLDHTSH